MFVRWYRDLYQRDRASAGAVGGLLTLFWPVTGALLAADAVIEGTKLTAKGVSALSQAGKEERWRRESQALSLRVAETEARAKVEAAEIYARENEEYRRQEELRRNPPKPCRATILQEIHQEYLENLQIVEMIEDPLTRMALQSQASTRLRNRLARLIG